MTLLPALLGFAGPRIDRLRIPGTNRAPRASRRTLAARWSRTVERRPVAAAAAALVLVAALALPATGLRLGFPDTGNDAAKTTTRQAYELTNQGFGAGANGPLVLVAELQEDGRERLAALPERLSEEPGVAAVQGPAINDAGDTAMVLVQPNTPPQHQATQDLIERLRERTLPESGLDVVVGGATASFVDQSNATAERLPLFIAAVVVLSFLLLLVAFRSVVVPLKAGLMNLLSIGAAYGVVAYFADGGWAGELIGIETATPVAPFVPVIMFAVLFGLSMDYEVFLLSRIQEAYLKQRDTSRAVSEGIVTTGRVVVAAAAIMFAVFGAFVASQEVFLKLIGLGLATAILVDALVVRMVLVPAVMHLFGERNWWLPAWLDRRLPRLDIEGTAPPTPRPAEA